MARAFYGVGNVILSVIGIAGVVALMVLLCRKVLPKELDGTFGNKHLQTLHDYFNFKKLYIESVLRFLFVLVTVSFIVAGVLGIIAAIFGLIADIVRMIDYGTSYFGVAFGNLFARIITSILTLVIGPVATRLTYEGIMMFILLVKNTMEINGKLKAPQSKSDKENAE